MGDFTIRLAQITSDCALDMHEPDSVNAEVKGTRLDNAMGDNPERNCGELTVGITDNDGRTEWFNLATLIAYAKTSSQLRHELESCVDEIECFDARKLRDEYDSIVEANSVVLFCAKETLEEVGSLD